MRYFRVPAMSVPSFFAPLRRGADFACHRRALLPRRARPRSLRRRHTAPGRGRGHVPQNRPLGARSAGRGRPRVSREVLTVLCEMFPCGGLQYRRQCALASLWNQFPMNCLLLEEERSDDCVLVWCHIRNILDDSGQSSNSTALGFYRRQAGLLSTLMHGAHRRRHTSPGRGRGHLSQNRPSRWRTAAGLSGFLVLIQSPEWPER
jgi:hypothetical protein